MDGGSPQDAGLDGTLSPGVHLVLRGLQPEFDQQFDFLRPDLLNPKFPNHNINKVNLEAL